MRHRMLSFRTALAATLISVVFATPAPAFDLEAYKSHLRATRDLTAPQLVDSHRPYGPYLFKTEGAAPAEYMSAVEDFFELTAGEQELLDRHDFMVSERLAYPSYGAAMREIWHADLPLYVSSDAILHALHRSYVELLAYVEETRLSSLLGEALNGMHAGWPALEARHRGVPGMRASLDDVDVYLTVARSLLAGDVVQPAGDNHAAARALLDLIAAAKPRSVQLFNEVPRIYDFSQLKPRGHYAERESLRRYFGAMMWLGRTELRFTPAEGADYQPEDLTREIIDAYLLRELAAMGTGRSSLNQINEIIGALVGEQDNMTIPELDRLADALQVASPDQFLDPAISARVTGELEAGDYSAQAIVSQVLIADPFNPEGLVPPRAFLLIGQRFTPDAYIAGNVVYDQIRYLGEDVFRGLPSPLDILYALGNDDALPLLRDELDGYHYAPNLSSLRYLFDGYEPGYWRGSLYAVWLQAIRTLAKSGREPNVPAFMKTGAWQQQKMNSQLASWTELRHDNLLYAKQSYTGGAGCSYPRTYVEPIPELYRTLALFAERALVAFSPLRGDDSFWHRLESFFTDMQSIMSRLVTISEKELSGEALTDEELAFLSEVLYEGATCALVERGWYRQLFFSLGDEPTSDEDLLVADVHTQPTDAFGNWVGKVLHVATGHPQLGVFIATQPGQPRTAFVGPVASYMEHVTLDFERLTDQDWADLHASSPPARPDWTHVYLADAQGQIRETGRRLVTADGGPGGQGSDPGPTAAPAPRIQLAQNHPNPFNPSTRISFRMDVPSVTSVQLRVYDMRGRHVRTLLAGPLASGTYHAVWDGTDVRGRHSASGTYIARLQVGPMQATRKMVLVR